MVVATLAIVPLTLVRLGIYLVVDDLTVGLFSLAGFAGSLAVGLPYLTASRFLLLGISEWHERMADRVMAATTVCDHFTHILAKTHLDDPMVPESVAEDARASIRLVIETLPAILRAFGANVDPKSVAGRKTSKNFQKALHMYYLSAKLAEQLFK